MRAMARIMASELAPRGIRGSDGELTIKENGGTLHLSFGPNWKSNLEHFRLDSFRARFDTPVLPPVPVTFRIAGSGKVVLDMAGIAEFKRVAARRPPAPR